MAKIFLKKGRDYSVRRRHPWIFSGAIDARDRKQNRFDDGEIVEVFSSEGELLGTGYACSEGSIAVKMLLVGERKWTTSLWREKLQEAYDFRVRLGLVGNSETTAYRLVHAEGDGIPGLIVDHYDGVLVVQCQTKGIFTHREEIFLSLAEIYGSALSAIYLKISEKRGTNSGESEVSAYPIGVAAPKEIRENGLRFFVDWERGQKTGFFLDQRDNRHLLRKYARGKKVLNAFCYTGGFSVAALLGGAHSVESVDSSKYAIEHLEQNISLNQFSGTHLAVQADYLQYMQSLKSDFDLIVLDPPAFVKQQNALRSGLRGYRNINLSALRKIESGGILFTFSCSQLVSSDDFKKCVLDAACEAGRPVRILHQLHQAPCHPINLFHPEGEYLKGLVLEVGGGDAR